MADKTMKAAVLEGPEKITIMDVPLPVPEKDELQIKVKACGVCGSDIHMWKQGKGWGDIAPFHMGHEFCGIVTDPGQSDFKTGDRIIFWANLFCGECDMCRAGQEHLCRSVNGKNYIGFVRNGGYAEYFCGPVKNAFKLPDAVSDTAAALIDSLMVAWHAVRKSSLKIHDKVLVSGSGIIAQLLGALIKKAGASLLAMSRIDDRQIAIAEKTGNFDIFFNAADKDLARQMQEASKGGFDVVFEAVGTAESLKTCVDACRPGGEIVLIGNSMNPVVPFELNKVVLHEIRLTGSVSCTKEEFAETVDLIASGFINVEQFVTDIFPLADLQKAFAKQAYGSEPMLKSVIKM